MVTNNYRNIYYLLQCISFDLTMYASEGFYKITWLITGATSLWHPRAESVWKRVGWRELTLVLIVLCTSLARKLPSILRHHQRMRKWRRYYTCLYYASLYGKRLYVLFSCRNKVKKLKCSSLCIYIACLCWFPCQEFRIILFIYHILEVIVTNMKPQNTFKKSEYTNESVLYSTIIWTHKNKVVLIVCLY